MTEQQMSAHKALYAQDAEMGVIAGLLHVQNDAVRRKLYKLSEEDFITPEARRCFRACRMLAAAQKPVDLVTMDAKLLELYPETEEQSALQYAIDAGTSGLWLSAAAHAEIVRKAGIRRKLLTVGEELARMAADGTEDVELAIDTARAQLRGLTTTDATWMGMSDVLLSAYERLDGIASGKIKAIGTGLANMDKATTGLLPGEFTIVGARPSVGKTAFGLQLALTAAEHGAKPCFISVEMSAEQMGNRVFARKSGVDGMKIRSAVLNEDDWGAISEVMMAYSDLPISFLFGGRNIEEMRMEIQRKVELHECDMVILDYLQLIRTKRRFEKESERIGYVSRICKAMSLEFNIPVVALAQVLRQHNGGRSRCPSLDELRGSGDMEQDADNVILLHRPDDDSDMSIDARDRPYFNQLKERGLDYIVFNVAKQRQGRIGYLGAAFDAGHMRYLMIDHER